MGAKRAIFAAAIFASALLLFALEPLWARMLLPRFGGSAAVWSTLLVFYQAALLAGYALAHWAQAGSVLRARIAGVAAVGAVLASMPLVADVGPTGANPMQTLWWQTLRAIGALFVGMAMTNPLLQRQFARVWPAANPYSLYVASNAGSVAGLLLFPWLEWRLTLPQFGHAWMAGAALWAALSLAVWALPVAAPLPAAELAPVQGSEVGARRWFFLALGPSAALVGQTTWIASSLANMPLLWMLPLGAYLSSFMVVFAKRRPSQALLHRAGVLGLVPIALALAMDANHPTWAVLAVHVLGLFAICLTAHGQLAQLQPDAARLTRFYLAQSAGGVAGGLLAALVAPQVLAGAHEYPLALVGSVAAAAWPMPAVRVHVRDLAWALAPAGVALVAAAVPEARTLALAVACVAAYLLSQQLLRFALAVGLVLAVAAAVPSPVAGKSVAAARSFYGLHSVTADGPWMQLRHGATVHGRQRIDQRNHCVPQLYYHRTGPIGDVFAALPLDATAAVGLVGQGTGAVACYSRPRQDWTFFEIDPEVDRLARDPQFFTFLANAPARAKTVVGDARLTLQSYQGRPFDLLVLDAYASDSIPLHLLTSEAMALYWARLQPHGAMAFHLSNRYFDLPPVVAALAAHFGGVAVRREDAFVSEAEAAEGKSESLWVVVARHSDDVAALLRDPKWARMNGAGPLWHDDRASALDVLDVR